MISQSFITNNPYLSDSKVVIGVSGGVDSMSLFHLCITACSSVHVVHVNYHLRGKQSDADQKLVELVCDQYQIRCTVVHCDPKVFEGVNLQEEARNIRYKAYTEAYSEYEADYILTAHTADDSLETMVFNFFRGTDLAGLKGIKSGAVIKRPLYFLTKRDIYTYAEENQIAYREDASNSKETYTRNLIRNTILPKMESHLMNQHQRLKATQANLNRAYSFQVKVMKYLTNQLIQEDSRGKILPFESLDSLDFGAEFFHYWGREYGFSTTQLIQLYHSRTNGKFTETIDWILEVTRGGYILYEKTVSEGDSQILIESPDFEVKFGNVNLKDHLEEPDYSIESMTVDQTQLVFPLTVRYWIAGDRMPYRKSPKQSKKLKKLFSELGLTQQQKRLTPIIVNGNGEILWVLGVKKNSLLEASLGYTIYWT